MTARHSSHGSRDWRLPEQPKILARIESLAHQPQLNIRNLATLVIQDVGLSALILKAVNSSYFGLENRIGSIEQAIALLGLEQTLNIARTESLRRAGGVEAHALANSRITARSRGIATLCSIIAAKQFTPSRLPSEHAYMIGQFHDCGIGVLMRDYPDYCETLDAKEEERWPDLIEQDRLNETDHALVGCMLAENWGLPNPVCQAIRHHHDIQQAAEEALDLVATLQMAMHLYNGMTGNDDSEWVTSGSLVLQALELEPDDAETFEEEVSRIFRERKVHAI